MSQKKLKKLKKIEDLRLKKESVFENIDGLRKILKDNWKFLFFLTIGMVALYFNSLFGDFVSDDYAGISQNPMVMDFMTGFNNNMVGVSNWFLAKIFGVSNPLFFHSYSLILYILVCYLVFVLVTILVDKKIAILTTILFAVLPIHVEAISWISGKPYLLNALFVLLSFIIFILYSKTENKKYFWIFLILLPITFFAEKARFPALIFLIVLYLISFDSKFKRRINLPKILGIFFALLLLVGAIMWPQITERITSVNGGYNGSGGIFYDPFFQYPTAIPKYLQLLFVPVDLTLYHTMFVFPIWFNWTILLVFLGNVVYFWFKDKKIFFALSFIFLASAASMAPVKVSWLVAERYVFLGSIGFCLFLVLFLERLKK